MGDRLARLGLPWCWRVGDFNQRLRLLLHTLSTPYIVYTVVFLW